MKKFLIFLVISIACKASAQNTYPFPQFGNVGIGTTSPVTTAIDYSDLTIQNTSGGIVYFNGGNNIKAAVYGDGGGLGLYAAPGLPVRLNMGGYVTTSFMANGHMGLGYENPIARLEVSRSAGNLPTAIFHSNGGQAYGHVLVLATDGDGGADEPKLLFSYHGGAHNWAVGGHNNSNRFSIWENGGDGTNFGNGFGDERFTVMPGGNIGIGTSNPGTYKLAVNGNIRAKEIKVETGWSDFVFDENYYLPPLSAVSKYIKENHHLPNVPSAEEVEKNGIDLGKTNSILLRKIEELTLYLIEKDKKQQQQDAINKELSREIQALKKMIPLKKVNHKVAKK